MDEEIEREEGVPGLGGLGSVRGVCYGMVDCRTRGHSGIFVVLRKLHDQEQLKLIVDVVCP